MTKEQIEFRISKLKEKRDHLDDKWHKWRNETIKLNDEYPDNCSKSLLNYINSLDLPSIVKVDFEKANSYRDEYKIIFGYNYGKETRLSLVIEFNERSYTPYLQDHAIDSIDDWEERANIMELFASLIREFAKIDGKQIVKSYYLPRPTLPKEPERFPTKDDDELDDLLEELRILNLNFKEGTRLSIDVSKKKSEQDWREVEIVKIYEDSTFKGIVHYLGHTETIRRNIDYNKMRPLT